MDKKTNRATGSEKRPGRSKEKPGYRSSSGSSDKGRRTDRDQRPGKPAGKKEYFFGSEKKSDKGAPNRDERTRESDETSRPARRPTRYSAPESSDERSTRRSAPYSRPKRSDAPDNERSAPYSRRKRSDAPDNERSAPYRRPKRSDAPDNERSAPYRRPKRSDAPDNERSAPYSRRKRSDAPDNERSAPYSRPKRSDAPDNERSAPYSRPKRSDAPENERSAPYSRPKRSDAPDNERSAPYSRPKRSDAPDKGNKYERNDRSGTYREKKFEDRSSDLPETPAFIRPGKARISIRKKAARTTLEEQDGKIRLNKYIANAGICSRREADDLIKSGVIKVNGKIITEMGFRVSPDDQIQYGEQTLSRESKRYLLLNKPKDYITTADDPEGRKTVMELVKNACRERLYPVGRLDRATTGLLLMTNDGELAKRLTHPSHQVRKVYHVSLDKNLKAVDMKRIAEGLTLEDGPAEVDEISWIGEGTAKNEVGIVLHSGKNRIVRRIFEHLGYTVTKLDRTYFAGLTKKNLARGKFRFLTDKEVNLLKMS